MYCECGCGQLTGIAKNDRKGRGWIKGQPKRFIARHQARTLEHRNRLAVRNRLGLTFEHRKALSRGKRGIEPTLSPFIPECIVHFSKGSGRWVGSGDNNRATPHARMVWEYFKSPVPEGFRVHHKNGDPTRLEDDRLNNLMLLTEEWNLKFMPDLALGFGIPESEVTKIYLQVEHLPYERRFPEVCRFLLMKETVCPAEL
jgi:hypothetical protein